MELKLSLCTKAWTAIELFCTQQHCHFVANASAVRFLGKRAHIRDLPRSIERACSTTFILFLMITPHVVVSVTFIKHDSPFKLNGKVNDDSSFHRRAGTVQCVSPTVPLGIASLHKLPNR